MELGSKENFRLFKSFNRNLKEQQLSPETFHSEPIKLIQFLFKKKNLHAFKTNNSNPLREPIHRLVFP